MRKLEHHEIAGRRHTPSQLERMERFPVHALLDNIRSLYNVGSIFRSADGARLSRLILTGYTPCPPRKEIEKTALGATGTVPWTYTRDPLAAVAALRAEGIRICLIEQTDASIPYHRLTPADFPLCLVVGNEITGIRREIVSGADLSVDIPMFGMKHSLNAAVAFGIVAFECVRILGGKEDRRSLTPRR